MANTTLKTRKRIDDLSRPLDMKLLNDQLDWIWKQLMGALPEKALSSALRGTINNKVGTEDLNTEITQLETEIGLKANQTTVDTLSGTVTSHGTAITANANAIALKANQTTVDSLGNTVSSMSSTLTTLPGEITAEIENKSVHVGPLPPTGDGLYEGRLWQNKLTNEQLRWKGLAVNTARSYAASVSGASVSITDLSDDLALDVTVKTVAAQAGTGTPSPTNIRAISGKASAKAIVNTVDKPLSAPDATLYGLTGYEDEIGNDGDVTHKTALVTLVGTESWTWGVSQPANTALARFSLVKADMAYMAAGICSHFPWDVTVGKEVEYATAHPSTAQINIFINKSRMAGWSDAWTNTQKQAAFKAWLAAQNTATTPVRVVYRLATTTTATVAPVEINGADGTNTVTSDGASVVVGYTGSGWALVSGDARRVYASSSFTVDENGATVRHILLDGVTPYEAYTRLYGGGLEIYDSGTDDFIGGLRVVGGKVVLAASALSDPRVSTDFYANFRVEDVGGSDAFGLAFNKSGSMRAELRLIPTYVGSSDYRLEIRSEDDLFIRGVGTVTIYDGSYSGIIKLATGTVSLDGADIVPTSNGEATCGASGYGFNYFYGTHTSIQSTSDERAKRDMRTLDPDAMLRFIMALDATWYRLNSNPEDLMAGFRAQQFMEAMRAAGIPLDFAGFNGKDPDHLALDYCQVIAPLVSAFQSQQHRIDELERKLNALTGDGK